MLNKNHIKIGDEVIVNNRGYIVEEMDKNDGLIYAVGNNGEEWEGNADQVDAHFPSEEKWQTFK
tara:strand:- start:109 stop:300 length:192 start_codon:yes stop_codon:yes gene_type:complete